MPGWDGKKTEPIEKRVYVCVGCRKTHHPAVGGTLIRRGNIYVHPNALCRRIAGRDAKARNAARQAAREKVEA